MTVLVKPVFICVQSIPLFIDLKTPASVAAYKSLPTTNSCFTFELVPKFD